MDEWEYVSCVRFVERTNQYSYVYIHGDAEGCYSHVGFRNAGVQEINVAPYCDTGSVVHEVGHTMGLWHEQSREDRNKYVRVRFRNIEPDRKGNFEKSSYSNPRGLPYDYDSIMHYGTDYFSKNGKDTIIVRITDRYIEQGSPEIGQRSHLSDGDIDIVNLMYC